MFLRFKFDADAVRHCDSDGSGAVDSDALDARRGALQPHAVTLPQQGAAMVAVVVAAGGSRDGVSRSDAHWQV